MKGPVAWSNIYLHIAVYVLGRSKYFYKEKIYIIFFNIIYKYGLDEFFFKYYEYS